MTSTTKFGTSRRESHDASAFYARNLVSPTFTSDTQIADIPKRLRNRIFEHSAEVMTELPDSSIAMMITSPPYHVGKDYDADTSYAEYLELMATVLSETHRVLEPGGRAAINVANLGRRPYIPLTHDITRRANQIGFHMRGEIIWRKAAGASGSCAFGSFQSASNPVLRDLHEYILVFSKGQMNRARRGINTISKEAFLRDTLSIWDIPPESARRVGHPAPFPIELPKRLIELYTYQGDVVLDPFMGSGSTAVAALLTERQYVGYETVGDYARLARKRIKASKDSRQVLSA